VKVLFYYRGSASIGIQYLSAILKQNGHKVELLFDPGLDDNLFIKCRFLHKLNCYDKLLEKAHRFSPDLIAFSVPSNLYPFVKRMAALLKKDLKTPIIAGGPHPTILPEHVLADENIDMICIGEGDYALLELADKMEKDRDIYSIENIWFKKDGKILKNKVRPLIENLDILPFPDKELFYNYGVFEELVPALASRGCPFQCTFCANHAYQKMYKGKGKYVRMRSVDNLIEELKEDIRRIKGLKYFVFYDDTFTLDHKWLEEFSKKYRKQIGIPFDCCAHPSTVDERIVSYLKEANCYKVFLGIDSGDDRIRRQIMKRYVSQEQIVRSARLIKSKGIKLTVSAIFGFPDEDESAMWKTAKLTSDTRPNSTSSYIFYPYYGTDAFEHSRAKGYLNEEDISLIKNGTGSYHQKTLLKHPHAMIANTYSKMLPIYNKAPKWLKPVVKKLIDKKQYKLANFLYIILIPILFPLIGFYGIKDTVRMARKAVSQ